MLVAWVKHSIDLPLWPIPGTRYWAGGKNEYLYLQGGPPEGSTPEGQPKYQHRCITGLLRDKATQTLGRTHNVVWGNRESMKFIPQKAKGLDLSSASYQLYDLGRDTATPLTVSYVCYLPYKVDVRLSTWNMAQAWHILTCPPLTKGKMWRSKSCTYLPVLSDQQNAKQFEL